MTSKIYKVVFDNGKPYEETFNTIQEVEQALTKFYNENKNSHSPFDAKVYYGDEDISETQAIQEFMIGLTGID